MCPCAATGMSNNSAAHKNAMMSVAMVFMASPLLRSNDAVNERLPASTCSVQRVAGNVNSIYAEFTSERDKSETEALPATTTRGNKGRAAHQGGGRGPCMQPTESGEDARWGYLRMMGRKIPCDGGTACSARFRSPLTAASATNTDWLAASTAQARRTDRCQNRPNSPPPRPRPPSPVPNQPKPSRSS